MFSSQKFAVTTAAGGGTDNNFENVTLLLNGDGTNGAQNNTFVDSSTNNFTITRNGNTTQGSFSPYGSLWSNYFNASSSYLTVPYNSAIDVGTGAFTFELFIYANDVSGYKQVLGGTTSNSGNIYINASTIGMGRSNINTDFATPSNSFLANQWNHVVFTRNSSNNLAVFINGTRQYYTASNTYNYGLLSGTLGIGIAETGQSGYYFGGYISNFRLFKSAYYDPTQTTITVPTTQLTAVSGTALLTCQSNRFIDNSSNAFTITVAGGTPSVQRFSPFNPTASYSTATIGGSGYFDGSGDYLTASSSLMAYGTSTKNTDTFTCEAWVYLTSYGSPSEPAQSMSMISKGDIYFTWGIYSDGKAVVYSYDGSTHNSFSTGTIPLNTWTYLAFTVSGGTITHYINGVSSGTGTWYGMSSTTDLLRIGRVFNTYWNGYISNLRISTNARTITLPTAPLTSDANTALLCKYDNAGIPDSAMMNDLETVGNAQVSTSVKKYGTGSLYFDGTGDYLTIANNNVLNFGTGDFTAECWVYVTSWSNANPHLFAKWNDGGNGYAYKGRILSSGSSLRFGTGNNGSLSTEYDFSGANISLNTWYHIAFTRSGSSLRAFVNGTQIGSTQTTSNSLSSNSPFLVGASSDGGYDYIYGYIDDLRITKGYARYTANFTPPTAALPVK